MEEEEEGEVWREKNCVRQVYKEDRYGWREGGREECKGGGR